MSLKEQIDQDLVSAMKEKNELSLSVLRMLKTAVHNAEINQKNELENDGILKVIQAQIKSRQDSILMYEKGERLELAEKEKKEIEILKKYLPEQMNEEELELKVKDAIAKTGASSIRDMGKVMGVLTSELAGKADPSQIAQMVKKELENGN